MDKATYLVELVGRTGGAERLKVYIDYSLILVTPSYSR